MQVIAIRVIIATIDYIYIYYPNIYLQIFKFILLKIIVVLYKKK